MGLLMPADQYKCFVVIVISATTICGDCKVS